MKFSYHWLKELARFKDTPEQLGEFLTMRVFEVEEVKKSGDDWTLDIKVLPNRIADASGHIGMAREIASLKNYRLQTTNYKQKTKSKTQNTNALRIVIENAQDCPRYTARVMNGVRVGPSPAWMRERLETCGLQSINNLVDAANYVMLETGQPLHIFDADKIGVKNVGIPKSIVVRRAKAGEKMPALDDKTYTLNPDILVIADAQEPLAIAGIKGGKSSGVSTETRTIIIEAANFNPLLIRHASQALGLRTDASIRFQHGLDPNETARAADRLAQLIQEIAGGEVIGNTDVYPKKENSVKILFRPDYAARLIGAAVPGSFYPAAFSRLGWSTAKKGDALLVTPPTARRDVRIEEDIVEEIARLFDYKNIKAVMPETRLASPEKNMALFWEERVRDHATAIGFTESMLAQFTGDKELEAFGFGNEQLLTLQNPTSPETQYLVPRILIKYIASVAENLRHYDAIRIFGIGKNFAAGSGGVVPNVKEHKKLIMCFAQKGASGEEEFYLLKGATEQLLESLGISDHWYDDQRERGAGNGELGKIYHPYRFAEIKIGDENIGVIGEIHPTILKNIKARGRIAAAEIDMEKLTRLATAEAEYRPIGRYPAIIRDIAVVVPEMTKTEEILNVIEAIGGELLADTDLFDYFQDGALADNAQKSLAFHLVFQSPERTLTDTEIDIIIKKITAALEEKRWGVKK